ncbi:MAG: phenylacetate--CoA ligase family protein [Chloroflexi bacterium]|nr:phenylacetate--CoA ligase family protein [Chloroflexota bacterium]
MDGNYSRWTAQPHSDLANPTYVAWREFLRRADAWDADAVRAHQLHEVQRILSHAYASTRGYRALFDAAGVAPADVRSLDDVRRLPLVDKELIRDNLADFTADISGKSYTTTGGSTGIPFGFYRDADSFAKELASKAHQYERIGWKEGDRQIVFRGLPIDNADHMVFVPEFNELRCSSYHLVPEQMEIYRQAAWDYRPDWIRTYPSAGYLLAQWVLESGRAFPPIKGILCASENLYDFQKQAMRKAFPGARVFSHYGHYELAVLAGFCEHNDLYHVLPQYGYAELIDADGNAVTTPGQMGEIVGTSFLMHATPFVRYRTRDYAVLKGWGCSDCGRSYQTWERIEGRLQEFILTAGGRMISMTAINYHDDIFDHIRQFQFYQKEVGRVTFRYIPKPSCTPAVLEDVRARLRVKLGDDVELTLEAVTEIPLTGRGKHRFLIQELSLKNHDHGISVHVLGAADAEANS